MTDLQSLYAGRRRAWTEARLAEIAQGHAEAAAALRAAGVDPADPKAVAAERRVEGVE